MGIMSETELLNRLFKAARAYYLMNEGEMRPRASEADLIKEEMTAALVAARLITENVEERDLECEWKIEDFHRSAKRRREWMMAKILADGAFKATGEILELEAKTRLP